MTTYIIRRFLVAIPVLFGISVMSFLLISVAPGDAIDAMIDPNAEEMMTTEAMDGLRRQLGLDKPVHMRYLIWIRELAKGNFGYRTTDRRPVAEVVMQRLPYTLELMGISIFISTVLALTLGIISALKRYSLLDYVLTFFTFCGVSIPGFFVALLLILYLGVVLDLLPTHGIRTPDTPPSVLDNLRHIAMPVMILTLNHVATLMRQARSSMLDVLQQDYMIVARAKGLRERAVVLRHGVRNALLPLITLIGLSLPALFGGSVIVETIFAWPGMGELGISSVRARDFQTLMALNFISASLVMVSNLLTDITYAFVDPRISYD